jgi:translocation and assembly module TamB
LNIDRLTLFRDVGCDEMTKEIVARSKTSSITSDPPILWFGVSIKAQSSIVVQSRCVRGKFSTSPDIRLTGTNIQPTLEGILSADTAVFHILKARFDVRKAVFQFFEFQKYDPTVDIQMDARISSYTIYWTINGQLSKARLNLSSEPSTLSNGDLLTQADLISMISTGAVPTQSSSANLISASPGVASFLGVDNVFENTLNETLNSVTGGLIDSVSVVPTTQNGQLSWRATVSRSVSRRLNLGVSYEDGSAGNTRSAYADYMFNDTVSAVGSWDYSALSQQPVVSELFGGLRFNFGSQ